MNLETMDKPIGKDRHLQSNVQQESIVEKHTMNSSSHNLQPTLNDGNKLLEEEIISRTLDFQAWLEIVDSRKEKSAGFDKKLTHAGSRKSKLTFSKILTRVIYWLKGTRTIEVIQVDMGNYDEQFFLGGHVDLPKAGNIFIGSSIQLSGWVVGRKSQPTSVKLFVDDVYVAETPINILRPDVSSAFCITDVSHLWGYSIVLNIKKMPRKFTIHMRAAFPDSSDEFFSFVEFCKY